MCSDCRKSVPHLILLDVYDCLHHSYYPVRVGLCPEVCCANRLVQSVVFVPNDHKYTTKGLKSSGLSPNTAAKLNSKRVMPSDTAAALLLWFCFDIPHKK